MEFNIAENSSRDSNQSDGSLHQPMMVRRKGDTIYYSKQENINMQIDKSNEDNLLIKNSSEDYTTDTDNAPHSLSSFKTFAFEEHTNKAETEKCIAFWKTIMERKLEPVKSTIIGNKMNVDSKTGNLEHTSKVTEEAVKKATNEVHAEYRKLWMSLIKELQNKKLEQLKLNSKVRCQICDSLDASDSDNEQVVPKDDQCNLRALNTWKSIVSEKKKSITRPIPKDKKKETEKFKFIDVVERKKKSGEYCKWKDIEKTSSCKCNIPDCKCKTSPTIISIKKFEPKKKLSPNKSSTSTVDELSSNKDEHLDSIITVDQVKVRDEESKLSTDEKVSIENESTVLSIDNHTDAEILSFDSEENIIEEKEAYHSDTAMKSTDSEVHASLEIEEKADSRKSLDHDIIQIPEISLKPKRQVSMVLPTGKVEVAEKEPVTNLHWEISSNITRPTVNLKAVPKSSLEILMEKRKRSKDSSVLLRGVTQEIFKNIEIAETSDRLLKETSNSDSFLPVSHKVQTPGRLIKNSVKTVHIAPNKSSIKSSTRKLGRNVSMLLPTGELEFLEKDDVSQLDWENPQRHHRSLSDAISSTELIKEKLAASKISIGNVQNISLTKVKKLSKECSDKQVKEFRLPSTSFKSITGAESCNEWRLLGQERDESFLFSWVQTNFQDTPRTCIGEYNYEEHVLKPIYSFEKKVDCIQASINSARTVLVFVLKEKCEENEELVYRSVLYKFGDPMEDTIEIKKESKNQTFVQFLNFKSSLDAESLKFLLLVHQEGIYQYQIKTPKDDITRKSLTSEILAKNFFWAQWDPMEQTLYYIHNKYRNRGLVEGEEIDPTKITPTLSGLQFHDDQPHESVLNIPLNLPHLSAFNSCATYEDDVIPLRIHDSSLDLIVLTNPTGCVCICHHYLYQPIQPTVTLQDDDDTTPINFAYSVTALHQSCVIHCIINDIPWNRAKKIRPLFKLRGDSLIVFIPEICTHLLDVGLMHEPVCHVTTNPLISDKETHLLYLAPLISADDYIINLTNLDLIDTSVLENLLIETFKSDTISENKLAILHYFLLHLEDVETASQLICWHSATPFTMVYPELLKEFLLATSYAAVQKNLPVNATKLATLLPITTQRLGFDMELKHNKYLINLRQEVLWNASMMVISPQLRIVPYKSDLWVKLWDHLAKLSKVGLRFRPSQVLDKLRISLDCYQPEALSRSSTPLSPSGGASSTFTDFLSSSRNQTDFLPFHEIDSCTASRQEHIISVNLRELSMHLLKQTSDSTRKFQTTDQSAMHVHAVATRYVGAQLDQSRQLCQIICKAATYDPTEDIDKGFILINNLEEDRRYILFKLLEKYYMAVESLAFPLPQGFTSFFTYLGYRTMDFQMFEQYVKNHVFQLQIDVMKIILAENSDTNEDTARKLKLLSLLPRQRAKRLLNQWNHPIGVVLRAREHSQNILSGVTGLPTRSRNQNTQSVKGLGSFPSGNNMSPLDTFLDLLTAKASLTDIDFGLLIEATESSIEDMF